MSDTMRELQENLDNIRRKGIQKKLSEDKILKNMITFLLEYRKNHTLSVRELEKLLTDNKQLTKEMLNHISKIKSLSGV